MQEIPDAPVFTIHDSLMTTSPFVDAVRAIIIEEFSRLGLSPTLHEDDYGKKAEADHETLSEPR